MYIVMIMMPLISGIITGIFGRRIGEGSVVIGTICILISSVMSWYAFYEVGICGNIVEVEIMRWINTEMIDVNWKMKIDSLTVIMLILVTTVSTLVHIYSIEYMKEDRNKNRFMSYLSMFTFSMLILVTGSNYLVMFLGWEGIGLCSYLLIGFWYERIEANRAAIQAMLMNRIGDIGLILGIIMIYIEFRTLEYNTVLSMSNEIGEGERKEKIKIIGILLTIGAMGKSAQFGLQSWIYKAMEGPTPVSAFLHAATLVTSGVYLIVRSSGLIEYSGEGLIIISIVGGMTAIYGATSGMVQNDLKGVIAFSTASQVGYMLFVCGLSSYGVGMFHMLNHGFFKALLFLSAGSIIHGIKDEQDMRKIGGLRKIMPYTYGMMMIGSMALMGFPFMAGYYSKDVILEMAYVKANEGEIRGIITFILGSIGAMLTAFYSMRLIHLTFLTKVNMNRVVIEEAHEGNWRITVPLWILSIGSIWLGYMLKDMLIGVGTDYWGNAIYVHPENQGMIEGENLPIWVKWIPVVMSISGAIMAWIMYTNEERRMFNWKKTVIGRRMYIYLNRKWYFDKVYTDFINQSVLYVSYKITYKGIDKGILEMFGPKGISESSYSVGKILSKMQNGNTYNYIFVMIIGIIFMYCIN